MPNDTITTVSELVEEPWRTATVRSVEDLAVDVSEVVLEVPSWPGHRAGQFVEVRLPGAGRWERAHSYSIANAPTASESTSVRLAVPSGALAGVPVGSALHVNGPRGERLAWHPDDTGMRPLLLIGGGTGIVPLLAIAKSWAEQPERGRLQMIYSVKSLDRRLYDIDLDALATQPGADVATIVTGEGPAPVRRGRGGGRLSALDLELFGLLPSAEPECFVCGPTSFVESVTRMLVQTKHSAARIRTEWDVSLEEDA